MRSITLTRPPAGSQALVPYAGEDELVFSFNPAEAVFSRRGDSLHLWFSDSGSLEIRSFFPGQGVPAPSVILADGMRMDALEFLSLFAPRLSLPTGAGLSAIAGERPATGHGSLAPLAAEEDAVFLSPENAAASDTARHNLLPVYQEVIFQDGEITIGPSIYGNLLPIGESMGLHVHLNSSEDEMLDMDSFIAKLPGLFPENPPVSAIAVTGGQGNRVILTGKNLSSRQGTGPLEGLGTTQFDRYIYRYGPAAALTLYIETILQIAG